MDVPIKASVMALDQALSRIVATLEEKSLMDKTMIIMTADHGMTAI